MKSIIINRSLLTVSLALCGLFAYSFSGAQNWTAPTENPPDGNVPAPINVGTEDQAKRGNFGANILSTAPTTGAVWSNQYCDALGQNCVNQQDIYNLVFNNVSNPVINLFGGVHTSADCLARGGQTTYDPVSNVPFCRFSASSCPSGWTQYQNWSETFPTTARDNQRGCSCTTGSHSWSNTPVETCTEVSQCSGGGEGPGSVSSRAEVRSIGCY